MNDPQVCLGIEDNKEALDCLKKVVASSSGPCRPQLVLLVAKDCEYCAEQEVIHKSDIDAGLIKKLDVASREGIDVIEKNDLEYIPALILLDCNGKIIV